MKLILTSNDPADPKAMGGKAAALAELGHAGLPIPQWFVIAPRPNVAAKLVTVGPCQTRACCSRWTRPSPRITFVAR